MATSANISVLNQFAKGLFQDTSSPVADFLAPVVPTGAAEFSIIDYGQRSGFQTPDARRAIGGDSSAVVTDGERINVSLQPYALHDMIDNHELDRATTGEGSRILREARVRNLVSQAGNSRLNETLTTLRAGVSAAAQTWGSSTDVISAIDEKMKEIADSIGLLPNRVVFNLGAWEAFKNNSTVIDRYPGAVTAAPQIGGIGSLFLNPDTQCMMSTSVFDSKIRQTSAKANALTSDVWIYYSSESVDMFDPSAFKTFRVRNNPFGGVRVVQKDFGEKVITEWTEAAFVNNAAAAARLDVTVS
ncbi:MAG: hypothetical protein CMJ25_01725 [Phycisphaerae bacterium]|nr:hypothetical protein [Phycisphaerae bacterium]|tara:strand:- start:1253 stop:2158 length:906 start_codon:yes stop_codon:yes gene_type:complete